MTTSGAEKQLCYSNQNLLEVASMQQMDQYPAINFKTSSKNDAIKVLDNMIQVEEQMADGISMFSRGKHLKKGLIDPNRVKDYLAKIKYHEEYVNFAED